MSNVKYTCVYTHTHTHTYTHMYRSINHHYPLRIFVGHQGDVECVKCHIRIYIYTHTHIVGHQGDVECVKCHTHICIYAHTYTHIYTHMYRSINHHYPLRIFVGHQGDVECVKFHPNCNYIATGIIFHSTLSAKSHITLQHTATHCNTL